MKKQKVFTGLAVILMILIAANTRVSAKTTETQEKVRSMYGENQIIDGTYDSSLAVTCYNGIFVGRKEGDVISYKGIPYARQPVGSLRWKSPEKAGRDNRVYEAYYYGKSPIQTEWISEAGSYYEQGEDCLTLNIWRNSGNTASGKPVMVFFHGGSYGWGGTSDPIYDGRNLVQKFDDIILVTVEYRTGIMGFIDFSSVEGGEDYQTSGNLGLLDQVCALQWIHDNITSFGGDPGNVTIFGESAGAGSVSLLPLIDGTEGLFQRIIAESGSCALTYSREECQGLTQRLLEETGCTSMEELESLSEEELKSVNEKLNDYNNFPERDGIVLPEDPYAAWENGAADGLDFLIGTNRDEVRYWINEMGYTVKGLSGKLVYTLALPILYENNLKRISSEDMEYVDQFMDLQSDRKIWNLTEFYNELLFRIPAVFQAGAHADNGGTAYMYYWTYPGADTTIGACHAIELSYVFDNLDETIYTGGHISTVLADTVQNMWVNFARTGNPSVDEIKWEPYNTDTRKTMILSDNIHMESDPGSSQRKLIEPLLKYYFNGCYSQLSWNVPQVYKIAAVLLAAAVAVAGSIFLLIRRTMKKEKKKTDKSREIMRKS